MKVTEFCLNNRTTTLALTAVTIVGGLMSYGSMGRLEDPEFTVKDALIITPYPGASAAEVEEEVSDEIERAVQALGQLKEVKSRSSRGLSIVTATMRDQYDSALLPQVWDELRRKVGDAQRNLPPGAGPSIVNDDFGDVFGVFFAIYGEEYSYAELWDVAKLLRRELLLVQDVAKIEVFGYPPEVVYVELDRDRMSQLGIPSGAIVAELQSKNIVANAGRVQVGSDFLTIDPTGVIESVEDLERILISGGPAGAQIYPRDVAAAIEQGARQVLIVGAGFDTLCLRLAPQYHDVQFFEVDHPATAVAKARGITIEGEPPNMTQIAADLGAHSLSDTLLAERRWDDSLPSVFVAEGLFQYLTDDEVRELLKNAAACTPPGSRFAFTHAIPGKRRILSILTRLIAEPWKSAVWSEDLPEYVHGTGWTMISDVDTESSHGVERYAVAERR